MEGFISLGKRIYDMQNPREVRRMWIFVARCLLHRSKLIEIDRFMHSNKTLAGIAEVCPYVYEQPTRAFFYNKSTFDERWNIVKSHMNFMDEHFQGDILRRIYSEECFMLWEGLPLNDEKFGLALMFESGQRKEGLLSVMVRLGNRWIYQIIFWLAPNKDGEMSMFIGAMQGPNDADARELIKRVTKHCHGLRTKNLILYAVQLIAQKLSIKHIYAVTNEGYYANNHVRVDRKLKTSFSDFWAEVGGVPAYDERFFELPLKEARKSIDEVPTRKRAVYRRRFALMDEIAENIGSGVNRLLKKNN